MLFAHRLRSWEKFHGHICLCLSSSWYDLCTFDNLYLFPPLSRCTSRTLDAWSKGCWRTRKVIVPFSTSSFLEVLYLEGNWPCSGIRAFTIVGHLPGLCKADNNSWALPNSVDSFSANTALLLLPPDTTAYGLLWASFHPLAILWPSKVVQFVPIPKLPSTRALVLISGPGKPQNCIELSMYFYLFIYYISHIITQQKLI